MLKSLLLLETINSPLYRRFLNSPCDGGRNLWTTRWDVFSLDGGVKSDARMQQRRNRLRALSPLERAQGQNHSRPETQNPQQMHLFSLLFTSSGILIFRGRHSDVMKSSSLPKRFTWVELINARICIKRGFTVETFWQLRPRRTGCLCEKSSRRAVKWQMKNYSRQFGDSKISDDVMIGAARPIGLTAPRSF